MSRVFEELKIRLFVIRRRITYKLIRNIILGIFYLGTVFRISYFMSMLLTTIAVLHAGGGQGGELPVRRENVSYDTNVIYLYDDQGRLAEEIDYQSVKSPDRWPITNFFIGMWDDEAELIDPFPRQREVWEYEENRLNKTHYVFNSFFPSKISLQMVLDYQYELDEQGNTIFYDRSISYIKKDGTFYYDPNKYRYEYDERGNISVLYDLLANGEVYEYHIYTYEGDLLIKKSIYKNRDDSLSSYYLYAYEDGLLIHEVQYVAGREEAFFERRYTYDEEGRKISDNYASGDILYRYYY